MPKNRRQLEKTQKKRAKTIDFGQWRLALKGGVGGRGDLLEAKMSQDRPPPSGTNFLDSECPRGEGREVAKVVLTR